MPLVRHHALPVFDELVAQGKNVLPLDRATHQDIRELHIGLLNMMPDAALEPTERQFLNLVGSSNQIAQLYVYPFTIPGLDRGEKASTHIDTHYAEFAELRESGLDALIVTGANVTRPDLSHEPFWAPLLEVIEWASQSVTSILCSCLASHALLERLYGLRRTPLARKRWGVFRHRVARLPHPLLTDVNTLFDVPHSRWNDIPRVAMEAAGVVPLITSVDGDAHLAVSPDGLRYVFMQGHPEYDFNSLLKEYKREVGRYGRGEIDEHPPVPERYFSFDALDVVETHRARVVEARRLGQPTPEFPDAALEPLIDNTWGDTAKAIFNNWLGLVYRLTHVDRSKPFIEGIDPADPLQLGEKWSTPR